MATGRSSFELFLSDSNTSDVEVSEDIVKKMNAEINNLRLSLKASEDALLAERQQKVKDRKLYEEKVSMFRKRCIDYCEKLNDEHALKLKSIESNETLEVPHCDQSTQAMPSVVDNCSQMMQPSTTNQSQQTEIIDAMPYYCKMRWTS